MAKTTHTIGKKELQSIEKFNAFMKEANKNTDNAVSSWKKLRGELTKTGSKFKEINKSTEAFETFLNISHDINKELKDMGVGGSKRLKKLTDGAEKAAEVFENLSKQGKKMEVISTVFSKIKSDLKSLKGGNLDAIKDQLGKLKGTMEDVEFESLQKGMESLDPKYPKGITNMVKELERQELKASEQAKTMGKELKKAAEKSKKGLRELITKAIELKNELAEGIFLEAKTTSAKKELDDFMTSLQETAFEVEKDFGGIYSSGEEAIEKVKGALVKIEKKHQDIKDLQKEYDKVNKKDIDGKERVNKLIKEAKEGLQAQLSITDKLHKRHEIYQEAVNKTIDSGFGVEESKKLAVNFQIASLKLQKLSKESLVFNGTLEKLSKRAEAISETMSKVKWPMKLLSMSVALGKAVNNLEVRTSGMYAAMESSGLLAGKTMSDIDGTMKSLIDKTHNVKGLFKATFEGNELALSRGEITGIVAALDKAGLAGRNLEKSMKGVKTTALGSGNELLTAANMAKTYSSALGLSTIEVAGMMGNLDADFNSTGKAMQNTLTGISNSFKDSNMSTTRFMGIVQTAGAGMALYEDQITEVADVVAKLGRGTVLTDKEIGGAVKSMTEYFGDISKTTDAMVVVGPNVMKAVGQTLQGKVDKLILKQEGMKKGSDEEKIIAAEITRMKELTESLLAGDVRNSAALMSIAGAEAQRAMMSALGDKLEKMGGKTVDKLEFLRSLKLPESAIQGFIKNKDYFKELGKKVDDIAEKDTTEDLTKRAVEINQKTGAATQKLLEASKAYFDTTIAQQKKLMKSAAAGGAALGGGMSVLGVGKALLGAVADIAGIAGGAKVLGLGGAAAGTAAAAGGAGAAGAGALAAAGTAATVLGTAAAGVGVGFGIDALMPDSIKELYTSDKLTDWWNEIFGSAQDMDKQMAAVEKKTRERYAALKAKRAKSATINTAPSAGTLEKEEKIAGAGAGAGGSVTIVINGGDIDKIRRVVVEEVNRINKGRG